jgi:glycosyltransferase A (GT-A) superfamily protein (DUF2064 family)
VAATPARRRVLVLDGRPGPWLPAGFEVIAQRGGGLGGRLAHAVTDLGAGPLVLVGMDTPQLAPADLTGAGDLLAGRVRRRAVLGPADDGGWWLLGLSHPDPLVFAGVPMSTAATGAEQERQLRRRRFTVRRAARRRDVDTAVDARAVAAAAAGTTFARTFAALDREDPA